MHNPLVIPQTAPSGQIEVYAPAKHAAIMAHCRMVDATVISDDATLAEANRLLGILKAHEKEIDARADELLVPLKTALDAVKSCRAYVGDPLGLARKNLAAKVAHFNQVRKERSEAAHREVQRAHQAEVDRIARENAERKRKADDEAAARAKAETEEAEEFAAMFGVAPEPPKKTQPAPVVDLKPLPPAPIISAPEVKAGARTRKMPKLAIASLDAIPRFVMVDGAELELMLPHRPNIMAALKGGIAVPGCSIEYVEEVYQV